MTLPALVPFAALCFSLALAIASVLRYRRSATTWCFFAGMLCLSVDSLFIGIGVSTADPVEATHWLSRALVAKSFLPAIWLCFSLTYSRGDGRAFLARWTVALIVLGLLPVVVLLTGPDGMILASAPDAAGQVTLEFAPTARVLSGVLVVALALILTNLEQTLRAAVGTMRWRIKFVIVALAVIFGTQIYVRGQAILSSSHDLGLWEVDSGALLIGCVLLSIAYFRTGWAEVDVYPSLTVLRSSLTLLIVGGYLFVVGVLAQLVRQYGGEELFRYQALVVLLGIASLAVLLLSDRFRQQVHGFALRHFGRAQHDSVRLWTLFSQRLANVRDQSGLGAASVRLISETFDALSVTLWLLDDEKHQLVAGASTVQQVADARAPDSTVQAIGSGLHARQAPFELDAVDEPWAGELRGLNVTPFANGGPRWCVPLNAPDRSLGALILADRVGGKGYTVEERELLKCIGDQITSILLNLRLAQEVVRAKELEAFQTLSAFFVHDLKNAASSLNLMLKNLPTHFDDPAFRADALRAVGNTAGRIDELIARLSALRRQPALNPTEADLNQVVGDALNRLGDLSSSELKTALEPVPRVLADPEQLQSVVTNLVLNARESVGEAGRIEVRTAFVQGRVVLSVADNGCGMSQQFVTESLFRPFRSTKSKGLGIGLFQTKAIVHAHGGSMQVESEVGKGTTFRVSLPARGGQ